MKARGRARVPEQKGVLRMQSATGIRLLLEESHRLPLVEVEVVLRTGSEGDPAEREGLTRAMARMLRMGSKKLAPFAVEQAIASMGARLSIDCSTSFVSFHAIVIRRHLEALFALLSELFLRPAFRAQDFAQVKRETEADLVSLRDNDRALASVHFRKAVFGGHPYGRPVLGTRRSVRALKLTEVRARFEALVKRPEILVGAAGDVTQGELMRLVDTTFGLLPDGRAQALSMASPQRANGRRVVLVDKPERTQTQMSIGSIGVAAEDERYFPLLVTNDAFGGTFVSRLMKEVRSVRGWSYGAHSRFGMDRHGGTWHMSTAPLVKDAADCARLELELCETWVTGGISAKERRFAVDHLTKSYCFDVDTPAKRLGQVIHEELFELPRDHHAKFVAHVRAVSKEHADVALRSVLSPADFVLVVVGTAEAIGPAFEKLPGVRAVDVVPFDQDL